MIDPLTNLQVFEPDEIKTVSLKYCVDLLTKRNTNDDYDDDYFIQEMVHLVRCEDNKDDDEQLTREDFDKRLKMLNSKCKDKYKFILNSGDGYRECFGPIGL